MKAEEFFERNRGKYFMYGAEKVRVVGFDSQHVIISTKKGGWEFDAIHNVDKLLLSDGEKGLYVNIKDLNPIDQPEPDLCKLLEGCEDLVQVS